MTAYRYLPLLKQVSDSTQIVVSHTCMPVSLVDWVRILKQRKLVCDISSFLAGEYVEVFDFPHVIAIIPSYS